MKAKVTIGNQYDSRREFSGGTIYAAWTTGWDIVITGLKHPVTGDEVPAKMYRYRNWASGRESFQTIPLQEMEGEIEVIHWPNVADWIKKEIFSSLHPNGSEEERNLFVYGEEEGSRINSENQWADAHKVINRQVTLAIKEKIGEFERVERYRPFEFEEPEEAPYQFIIDKKYLVDIKDCYEEGSSINFIKECDYDSLMKLKKEKFNEIERREKEEQERRRRFGHYVAKFSKKCNVPWDVAKVFIRSLPKASEAEIVKEIDNFRKKRNLLRFYLNKFTLFCELKNAFKFEEENSEEIINNFFGQEFYQKFLYNSQYLDICYYYIFGEND